MTAAETHAQHEARFTKWYGLRSTRATACPRYAAGRRCRAWQDDTPCVCQRHDAVLDHARTWLDETGRRVVTAEPYNANIVDLAELAADLDTLDLRATVYGRSPWNPGHTVLITITRKATP